MGDSGPHQPRPNCRGPLGFELTLYPMSVTPLYPVSLSSLNVVGLVTYSIYKTASNAIYLFSRERPRFKCRH
jgi:hypothetical protein